MNLIPLFTTPCWVSVFPNFQEKKSEILNLVDELREKNNSNSKIENIQFEPKLKNLFIYICDFAKKVSQDLDFKEGGFAIKNVWVDLRTRSNYLNELKISSNTFFGVFYLKSPPKTGNLNFFDIQKNSGMLDFLNKIPCQENNEFVRTKVSIEPVDGEIFIWPAYVPYSVSINRHDDESIAIYFDIIFLEKSNN